ncbi:NAD(P)/FAD-dependent oxidoreductase [Coralliovum pocilloporae]|uniref:NAD(P)/FAD-dependent oxidoreductase n=1 Tax=Coralliovum pocilloporae TaxID=3066369 RepID=UPI003307AB4E
MAGQFDAIVIGAGIIGSATALGLQRKGLNVLCLDKLPTSGYGSTSGSCAIIRPYYSTVDGSAIAYESHYYWKNWSSFLDADDERGHAVYNDCGCLVMKTPGNGNLASVAGIMDEIGCPYEELTAAEVREKLPMINTESFAPPKRPDDPLFNVPNDEPLHGAVFFPAGGYISDPQLAAHNLHRAAEAKGATFRFNAGVAAILKNSGRVSGVRLEDGEEILAPIVVNVAGPHSAIINEMAGVLDDMTIKTRALRHEVCHVPAPKQHDYEGSGCVYSDSDLGAYMRPETGNHILIGSEDPECDEREWVDPDDFNREFTEQWRVQVLRYAQRIPELGIPEQAKGVVELYDVSDDWIPIYDKSSLPGFYMAIGTSGNQFKNAPIAGEMMAELITVCEAGHDHDENPISFHLKYIDRAVSIGFYSRKRPINPNSSFSVLG